MKVTNKHNLPAHICAWLAYDEYDYDPETISMTTLIGPARAWALKRLNADKLTMDYSDLLAVRYGTAIHDSLEKVGVYGEGDFKEKRFYAELMGFRVSGKMDALRGGNYPPIRYQEQRIELWTIEAAEAYIAARLEEFAFALGSLPECTPEELWQTETTWAIFKNGSTATRAYRVAKSLEEAEELAAKIGGSWVKRPGMAKRCGYCTTAPFCDQYKRLKAAGCIDGD